jgi:type VI protein secretion system component Hcp
MGDSLTITRASNGYTLTYYEEDIDLTYRQIQRVIEEQDTEHGDTTSQDCNSHR